MSSTPPTEVHLRLTPDEALVLFEFLSRYGDTDDLRVEDQAEQRALWNLCCVLEKELREPFDPDYVKLVQSARDRLRDTAEESSEPDAAPSSRPPSQLPTSPGVQSPDLQRTPSSGGCG